VNDVTHAGLKPAAGLPKAREARLWTPRQTAHTRSAVMSKKHAPVDLSFDVAPAASPGPAEAAALALQAARRSAAAVSEAEQRAFADTEPAFMDTQGRDDT
jgi:hypothetical protein